MSRLKYIFKRIIKMDYKSMFESIKNVHKKTKRNSFIIFMDMVFCAFKYGAGYSDYVLFEMYNLNNCERETYITRGRNNELIKKYNNPEYNIYFRNKGVFNTKFKDFIKRDFIIVKDSLKQDVIEFMRKYKIFMVKPLMGTCGKGIEKIDIKDYKSLDDIYEYITKDDMEVLLEELIIQHQRVNKIYDLSINTVRIVTILDDDGFSNVVCAYFRIGNGKFVDNFNSGGMVAPVDEKKGIVIDKAIDKQKNLYSKHPITNTSIKGFRFTDWNKAIELVKKATQVVPCTRYVGWDVAFTSKGPVIVEGNEYPGYDIYQLPQHTPDKRGIWLKFNKYINKSKH